MKTKVFEVDDRNIVRIDKVGDTFYMFIMSPAVPGWQLPPQSITISKKENIQKLIDALTEFLNDE